MLFFSACSRKLKASISTVKVFSSVGFPSKYPMDSCVHEWRLTAPEGHMVKLAFNVFDSPLDDRVLISDGTEQEYGTVIGSYCSPSIYRFDKSCIPPAAVYSVGRYMWVKLILKRRSSRPFKAGISGYFSAVLPGRNKKNVLLLACNVRVAFSPFFSLVSCPRYVFSLR